MNEVVVKAAVSSDARIYSAIYRSCRDLVYRINPFFTA